MNERVRELAIKAGAMEWGDSVVPAMMNIEKFAELILQECAKRSEELGNPELGQGLLKHFGVEE